LDSAEDQIAQGIYPRVDEWAKRVLRIIEEFDCHNNPDYLGPFDLVGTYHFREQLERDLDGARPATVRAIDQLLRAISDEVGTSWVASLGLDDELGLGWWWGYIPARGPLRTEMDVRTSPRSAE
jgi:hypothetical protein